MVDMLNEQVCKVGVYSTECILMVIVGMCFIKNLVVIVGQFGVGLGR